MNDPKRDDLAFVFPGQGSQSLGMLGELAGRYPQIRATFDEASAGAGVDLWQLAAEGPDDLLQRTENTQPALLAAGVAIWRLWLESGGPRPTQLAGHSLGEYSALVCAGVLSLRSAAGLVAERGRLMQQAVPAGTGAMAAIIGGDDEQISAVCAEVAGDQVVSAANYNAPGQLVIAGDAAAVDRAVERLQELGVRRAVRLAVSVPSHCALMRPAADALRATMDEITWHAPVIDVVNNVDARVERDATAIRDALQRQLYMPVRWTQCIGVLAANGAVNVVECGPNKVLSGLLRRIDRSLHAYNVDTPDGFSAALAALGGASPSL